MHVHVGDGGHAAGDQLCQGQARPGLHGPVVQLGLGGEDPVVEPGLQVTAAAVAPEQGHGDVGVGVDEAGHEDVAAAVDLVGKGPRGPLGAHGADGRALDNDKSVVQERVGLVHAQGAAVVQKGGFFHGVL